MNSKLWTKAKRILSMTLAALMLVSSASYAAEPATAHANDRRAEIETSLYNAEYYAKANEDVAVALNNDAEAMYQHWLNSGKAEGRNASMVFNAKYYLEVNPDVAAVVGNDYVAAYEHFVNDGLLEGRESSPVFSVKYYLQANTDVAEAFAGDYVMAARHFNESAIAEGRSGSGNFDYTVYRECNTDVAALYDDYVLGYYIHYINHGRAEGRTGGLGVGDSGNVGGDTGSGDSGSTGGDTGSGDSGSTGGSTEIDVTAPSYRIFDAAFYLERYPSLASTVGTDADALYLYWISEGIAQGQTASPVIVPEEYLELNADVAAAFGDDYAAAITHFINDGILEGRTGSYEFDYSIYAACNTDVGGVFADDKVGYYFHYVKYGKAENRTAAVYVPPSEQPPAEEEPVVESTAVVTDADGRSYVLGFDADGSMIEQVCYDAAGNLLNRNTVRSYSSSYVITLSDDDDNTSAYWRVYYNAEGTIIRTFAHNNTGKTIYYAEIVSVNADGTVSCSFGSLEPQKQTGYYYRESGAVDYYYVSDYDANGLREKYTRYYADGTVNYYNLYVEYDSAGNCLRLEQYDADGTMRDYEIYEGYDANGNAAKRTTYNPDDSVDSYALYTYHANGELNSEEYYYADGRIDYYYIYDENGYPAEDGYYYYDSNNNLEEFYKSVYENGELMEYLIYDGSMNLLDYYTYEYEYDVTGETLLKSYEYDAQDALWTYSVYAYHENGRTKSITTYYASDLVMSVAEYNINGNIIQRTSYEYYNGELESYTVNKYEDKDIYSQVCYSADDSIEWYVDYEYDFNGVKRKQAQYYGDGRAVYLREYGSNGRQTKYIRYTYKSGSLQYYDVYLYNEQGKTTSRVRYDANDAVMSETEYVYENGLLMEEITYDASGAATGKYVYEYYDNGERKKTSRYTGEGASVLDYTTEYDENGYQVLTLHYNSDGSISNKQEYEYYDNGEWKKWTGYNVLEDGTMVLSYIYEYDENGNPTLYVSYNSDGSINYTQEYEYYDNGERKKEITYTGTGKVQSLNEYDTAGERTYWAYYYYDSETDELSSWQEYQYENGNEISYIHYDGEGNVTSKTLTSYNEAGDMVLREQWYYNYSTGEFEEKEVITYDGFGNETSCKSYDVDGVLTYHSETTYHNEDGVTKTYRYYYLEDGVCTGSYMYEYDLEGTIIKQVNYDADGNIISEE